MNVLVVAEHVQGKPAAASLEQLALARSLAGVDHVIALLVEGDAAAAQVLIARGADKVFIGAPHAIDGYNSDVWVAIAAQIAREQAATLVLAVRWC